MNVPVIPVGMGPLVQILLINTHVTVLRDSQEPTVKQVSLVINLTYFILDIAIMYYLDDCFIAVN